ncbi:hypothetical protein LE181_21705 [Streptomyces sp. SCA3-4]|uniref:hypothetical protein n=1 Tax=Streptomyces sichuanensis TaxID=2871810 RepID=UPI001CE33947|nr:hypothetical protein [Streptomyces sichuanensis]MCA6094776.1 hypothetical protein [Streptomyces sichuanensis]
MLVELDLFSGCPAPRWHLGPGAAEEFRTLTAALPPTGPVSRPRSPGLGYRGFTVTDGDTVVRVFAGRVTEGTTSRDDPGRHLERWLLSRLPPPLRHLRPVVAEAIDEDGRDA